MRMRFKGENDLYKKDRKSGLKKAWKAYLVIATTSVQQRNDSPDVIFTNHVQSLRAVR